MIYTQPMRPNELYHHGILGMKWGKRNGPPYPLRASSHSASEKKAGWKKSLDAGLNQNIKQGKGKDNISPAEKITRETRNAADNSSRALRKVSDAKKQKDSRSSSSERQQEISKMSDQELQQRIRRIEMERRYSDLTSTSVKNGYDKAADVLDVVGDIAGTAASVAAVAALVYKMKN